MICIDAQVQAARLEAANIRRSGPPEGGVPAPSHVPLTALLITNGDAGLCTRMRCRNSLTSACAVTGQQASVLEQALRARQNDLYGAGSPQASKQRKPRRTAAPELASTPRLVTECDRPPARETHIAERRASALAFETTALAVAGQPNLFPQRRRLNRPRTVRGWAGAITSSDCGS